MKKRVTRRKRKERRRRSVSKEAIRKVANLLTQTECKEVEKAAWVEYHRKIDKARETHCRCCPMNLVCLTRSCPDDAMLCVNCCSMFSNQQRLIVRCDGYINNVELNRVWQSGICDKCNRNPSHETYTVIEGFSFPTPDVEAIKIHLDRINSLP